MSQVDEEAKQRLQIDMTGAINTRLPKKDFPRLTGILRAWKKLDSTLGRVPYQSWENDHENHQMIIYISEPGYHTTKTLSILRKELTDAEARIKQLESQLKRA